MREHGQMAPGAGDRNVRKQAVLQLGIPESLSIDISEGDCLPLKSLCFVDGRRNENDGLIWPHFGGVALV